MKITKVSGRKYEVFDTHGTLVYTIKRVHISKYIVRDMVHKSRPSAEFTSLVDAKAHIRNVDHSENWLQFFVRHTRGKKFDTKAESNDHMKQLADSWRKKSKSSPSHVHDPL